MDVHANAKLGPAGRVALVELIDQGMTFRAAAAALGVSPATAHRWWQRRRQSVGLAGEAASGWFCDRSSRPHRSPRRLTADEERPILAARERTNLGPARLAGIVRRARSTVWKVLWRHGVSRRRRSEPRQSFRRYEWAQPGALLHMDTKHLPQFDRPGHWAHGDRSGRDWRRGSGVNYAHCVVDDHTRLAYVELHSADSAAAAAKTLERAVVWFREQGCAPVEAVMTDNALIYTRSRAFRDQLARTGARHIRTPKFTPRWNGKVERFIQTLDTEWAHSRVWPDSTSRDRALNSFLRYYNRYRPHSSLNDRPPISRVHNLHGQDS
jgi:transposase InsO family protein